MTLLRYTPNLAPRLCRDCGEQFQPTFDFHHYCSDRCSNRAGRKRRKRGPSRPFLSPPLPIVTCDDLNDPLAVERAKAQYIENLKKAGRL